MNKYLTLIFAVLICEAIGLLGGVFTFSSITTWYGILNKPFFTPPSYVFGPVWTFLYLLMGLSLFVILILRPGLEKKNLLVLFSLQLALNFFWSVLFFALHEPFAAFLDIVALWLIILKLIFEAWKPAQKASLFLIPYILWVSFAALLNISIVLLN